ncbi:hypothetical protein MTO96_045615 [Rhipicephalus appendiculatus]
MSSVAIFSRTSRSAVDVASTCEIGMPKPEYFSRCCTARKPVWLSTATGFGSRALQTDTCHRPRHGQSSSPPKAVGIDTSRKSYFMFDIMRNMT